MTKPTIEEMVKWLDALLDREEINVHELTRLLRDHFEGEPK